MLTAVFVVGKTVSRGYILSFYESIYTFITTVIYTFYEIICIHLKECVDLYVMT